MRSNATNLWMLLLFLTLSLVACKEDEAMEPEETTTESPAAPQPSVGDGDGAFWAIQSISTIDQPIIGPIDTKIGTAVGLVTPDNFTSFVDAGAVSVMGKALEQNDNNSYTYIPGLTEPTGLDFPASFQWSIGGAGNVTAFDHTVDFAFPDVDAITSAATVEKASGYTLSCGEVSQAMGVIFQVGDVLKEVTGNVNTLEFTADDLVNVPTGSSVVQVAAFTYKEEMIGGKTYYFGTETVRSLIVEIK